MNDKLFICDRLVYSKTDWLGGNLKPVHIGVYERDYGGDGLPEDIVYAYWDGTQWYSYGNTPGGAAAQFHSRNDSAWQYEPWRGLSKPVQPVRRPSFGW